MRRILHRDRLLNDAASTEGVRWGMGMLIFRSITSIGRPTMDRSAITQRKFGKDNNSIRDRYGFTSVSTCTEEGAVVVCQTTGVKHVNKHCNAGLNRKSAASNRVSRHYARTFQYSTRFFKTVVPNLFHLRAPWHPISINCTLHIIKKAGPSGRAV